MENKRVLVVDDNKDIRPRTDHAWLNIIHLLAANSGQGCLDILKKQGFDLVLLDLAMPGMSGLDVLSSLSENLETRPNNIVIFTASDYSDADLKKVRGGYGPIGRVNKPFTEEELLSVIDNHLK